MDRRDFIRQMGIGLAAGWAFGRLSWPLKAFGAGPKLCLALLADSHLKNGDDRLPEAQALARAVAEIKALTPMPDLVLFAGDLAHKGRPDALDLGREILSDLPVSLWAVRGEGDCGRAGDLPWFRRLGPSRFSRSYRRVHFLGLDTTLSPTPQGPTFELGSAQRSWLTRELARLDPATPLVIVSHAPLARLFLPWQQWTGDAAEIGVVLSNFRQVLCLHGHVHGAGAVKIGVSDQGSGVGNAGVSCQLPVASNGNDWCEVFLTENRKPKTENRLLNISLPATAWPLPQAVQGTPAVMRPGLSPHSCGWALVKLDTSGVVFRPHLWQLKRE
jgi:3',5'-cyclic AMP phosphodiesterase CpdA